jgi:hypothetical protein
MNGKKEGEVLRVNQDFKKSVYEIASLCLESA